MKFSNLIPALSAFSLILSSCDKTGESGLEKSSSLFPEKSTHSSFKVGFVGDSGYHQNFIKNLQLMRDEKVDLVIHLGDLAYHKGTPDAPLKWNKHIDEILGEKFPYLFVIGNHDKGAWFQENPSGYAAMLKKRLADNPEVQCKGEPGIKSYCTYRSLFFILSGIGTYETHHEDFIAHSFRQAQDYSWRVCAWHKNQKDLQPGNKVDEVGWNAYRLCQSHGALIATGHEHSYGRTKNLNDVGNRQNNHGAFGDPKALELDHGKTFAFVSGLGGHSLRPFNCLKKNHKWWATVFTNNYFLQNGVIKHNECQFDDNNEFTETSVPYNYGTLFITFNEGTDFKHASAQFKTVDGTVIDSFTIDTKL